MATRRTVGVEVLGTSSMRVIWLSRTVDLSRCHVVQASVPFPPCVEWLTFGVIGMHCTRVGLQGGAVYNGGTLTATGCEFTGNIAVSFFHNEEHLRRK